MGKYVATAALVLVVGLVSFRRGGDGFSIEESTLPKEQMDPALLVETVSHGERIEIEDYLIAGRWTVIEFTADW